MGELLQDIKVGARQLARQPGFAMAAILSLALGVGLNTTLFSVVNGVLLKSSPVAAPERLVEIYSGRDDFPQLTTSYPDYQSLRDEVPALESIAAHAFVRGVLSGGARPQLVTGEAVTANYFDVLGIAPRLGRPFAVAEDTPAGATPVVVVSHGLWQRLLGGRPDIVGSTVKLSGRDYTVIGVAPVAFPGTIPGLPVDFWVPLVHVERFEFTGVQWTGDDDDAGTTRLDQRATRWLFVKGRLAPGRQVEEARAQAETVFARLAAAYPRTNEKVHVTVLPAANIRFHPMVDGYVRAASAGMLAAVGLVLVIACANVASLLLARSGARRRELAVRAAIGASRGRLIRQLLTEGLALAALGGVLGTLLAMWTGKLIGALAAGVLPVRTAFDFSLDGTVLAFSLGVSVITALLFGLAPAWAASRPALVPALKDTGEGDLSRGRRVTLRDALVVGQLALSLVLLVAGALLARGLVAARGADVGFDAGHVASLSFSLQMNGYDQARATAFHDRALASLRALPGVIAVADASRLPLSADVNMDGYAIDGHHGPKDDPTPIDTAVGGADYFTVVGIPIVEGRGFTEQEIAQGRELAVVNETMAKQYWPGKSAIGQTMHAGDLAQRRLEVIGVMRDHKVRSVGEAPRPYVIRPPRPSRRIQLVVRTTGLAESALPGLRGAIWALEPNVVFTEDVSAAEVVDATRAPTRIAALLVGAFGLLALLLATVGLYGVVAYSVSLRTREVGIRMALGAERGQIVRMILGEGGRLALAGVVLGALGAAAVARLLDSLLYGVSAFDPLAYGAAALILVLVALAANLAPALGASRLAPVRALRT